MIMNLFLLHRNLNVNNVKSTRDVLEILDCGLCRKCNMKIGCISGHTLFCLEKALISRNIGVLLDWICGVYYVFTYHKREAIKKKFDCLKIAYLKKRFSTNELREILNSKNYNLSYPAEYYYKKNLRKVFCI